MAEDEQPKPERPLFKVGPVVNEYDRAWDIGAQCMPQVAPQALLRDLHRPVKQYFLQEHDIVRHELPRDGGRAQLAEARKQYFVKLWIPIHELIPTRKWWIEEWRELQRVLKDSRWQDAPKIESLKERTFGGPDPW